MSLDSYVKEKTPPTEKQISYIKVICETLDIDYKEPKTKAEARKQNTVWQKP